MSPQRLTSLQNPLLQRVRQLAREGSAYRSLGEVWLEGEHLCTAARARDRQPSVALLSDTAWACVTRASLAAWAPRVVVVPDALFARISELPSPAGIGFLLPWTRPAHSPVARPTVVLDRVQDAGNVGSILRTASALGFGQVIALKGTAALWSAKVLRAGMGAQFALSLHEGLEAADLQDLALPLLATSSHAAQSVGRVDLPHPCAWVFGSEGQGVSADLLQRCAQLLRIPQPGGEESLNVAAAAAICLYESARRRPQQGSAADPSSPRQ